VSLRSFSWGTFNLGGGGNLTFRNWTRRSGRRERNNGRGRGVDVFHSSYSKSGGEKKLKSCSKRGLGKDLKEGMENFYRPRTSWVTNRAYSNQSIKKSWGGQQVKKPEDRMELSLLRQGLEERYRKCQGKWKENKREKRQRTIFLKCSIEKGEEKYFEGKTLAWK